jgi:hypothetical protein
MDHTADVGGLGSSRQAWKDLGIAFALHVGGRNSRLVVWLSRHGPLALASRAPSWRSSWEPSHASLARLEWAQILLSPVRSLAGHVAERFSRMTGSAWRYVSPIWFRWPQRAWGEQPSQVPQGEAEVDAPWARTAEYLGPFAHRRQSVAPSDQAKDRDRVSEWKRGIPADEARRRVRIPAHDAASRDSGSRIQWFAHLSIPRRIPGQPATILPHALPTGEPAQGQGIYPGPSHAEPPVRRVPLSPERAGMPPKGGLHEQAVVEGQEPLGLSPVTAWQRQDHERLMYFKYPAVTKAKEIVNDIARRLSVSAWLPDRPSHGPYHSAPTEAADVDSTTTSHDVTEARPEVRGHERKTDRPAPVAESRPASPAAETRARPEAGTGRQPGRPSTARSLLASPMDFVVRILNLRRMAAAPQETQRHRRVTPSWPTAHSPVRLKPYQAKDSVIVERGDEVENEETASHYVPGVSAQSAFFAPDHQAIPYSSPEAMADAEAISSAARLDIANLDMTLNRPAKRRLDVAAGRPKVPAELSCPSENVPTGDTSEDASVTVAGVALPAFLRRLVSRSLNRRLAGGPTGTPTARREPFKLSREVKSVIRALSFAASRAQTYEGQTSIGCGDWSPTHNRGNYTHAWAGEPMPAEDVLSLWGGAAPGSTLPQRVDPIEPRMVRREATLDSLGSGSRGAGSGSVEIALAPLQRSTEGETAAATSPEGSWSGRVQTGEMQAADTDSLAKDVYAILRRRLTWEKERGMLGG